MEALLELWVELPEFVSGGVMGLEGDSEDLEAPQELRSGGGMGFMYDSEVVEEFICGGVMGLVGPAMPELRSSRVVVLLAAGCGKLRRASTGP